MNHQVYVGPRYSRCSGIDRLFVWYANYLKETLPKLLGVEMTQGRMVYELVRMADEAGAGASEQHWSELYAVDLIKKYG